MDLPRKRARLSVVDPVVLGARVKAARVAAGLTQGDVAQGDLSVSYLSRIESGKRRPDVSLLDVIATRLAIDVEYLLPETRTPEHLVDAEVDPTVPDAPGNPVLDFAEIAIELGDAESALAQLAGIDPAGLAPHDVWRVDMVRAQALEATGDLNGAIEVLETLPTRTDNEPERIRVGIALSRCHRELGEFGNAIRVGEEALARAAELGIASGDESVQLSVTVAAAYFEQGDHDQAIRLCRRSIAAADTLASPVARASAYWNTSMMTMENGDTKSAVHLARRALSLLSEGSDNRNVARLRAQLGLMELGLEPPQIDSARELLQSAGDEMRLNHATEVEMMTVSLGLARCALLEGSLDTAWDEALSLLPEAEKLSAVSEADVHTLLGETAAARGDLEGVRESLLKAVHRLHSVGSTKEAGQRWLDLAGLLESSGELDAARAAYRAAAVSTGLRPRIGPVPAPLVPRTSHRLSH